MNGIAATIGDAGRRDMFYLSPSFGMKQRLWDGTHWTNNWIDLGGIFTSAPAAVATMAHHLTVVIGDGDVTSVETGTITTPTTPLHPTPTLPVRTTAAPINTLPTPTATTPRVGGTAVTGPLVQRLDVFGLGLDYAMYHKTSWGAPASNTGPWENLGGIFTSAPAALALDGHIHVFGLGTDYSMFHRVWNGSAWSSGWERLGGFFSSAGAVVSWGPGRFDIFARGADFTLRHRTFENNGWANDWQNLGGSLASPPVAVSWGPNRLDVFAVNHDDGGIIHRWWDGMIWNDWEHVAGTKDLAFTSMPAAATWGVGRLDVLATGSDGALYHMWSSQDAWSQPESLGGQIASTPTLLAPAVNALQIIAPGNDGNLYHKQWTGSAWSPAGWEQLGDRTRLPSRFSFSIDHMRVDTSRSLNNDTDSGQCSLAIGNWPTTIPPKNWPLLTKTQRQGDLGGTAVKEGPTNLLNFGPMTVELCESAIFNYTFINSGGDPSVVSSTLIQQGTKLADSGVQTIVKDIGAGLGLTAIDVAGASIPLIGSLVAILSSWLISQLNSIINARCDGVVAVEQVVMMGRDLQAKTRNQPLTQTTIHAGTDSPTGCGSNSKYEVSWSMKSA
ncbi:MAG TPA: hypothetical protein VH583_10000 [Vicinamibacterales bacterium]|jgi:hypothetical protein